MFLLKFFKIIKLFKFSFKNNAGRNNQGRVTVYSKGVKKKSYAIPLIKLPVWDKNISAVVSIFRNKKKLLTLHKHTTGSFSVKPYLSGMIIGQKTFVSNLPKKFWLSKLPGNFVVLKFLKKFNIFSNLYINNVRTFALSNGTFCQVLDFFYDFNLVKITLPSKKIKIISGYNFVFLGKNSQTSFNSNRLGKAGIRILTGKKPKVRGVARNPVDHPHGGRTKTNQPEVSVWGWVAKKNK